MITGTVFDIKEFTVHDGPGVRVTVFLKGCPLRCKWCHNPEGLSALPQIMVRKNACVGCGACKRGCSHPECQGFDRCIHACPNGLIKLKGTEYTDTQLSQKLNGYKAFFRNSGGITFSGGEPLLQHEFLCSVLKKTDSLHRAIETSGYADSKVFEKVTELCDLVIMDIKLIDRELHKKYTGVYNDVILDNYRRLVKSGKPHIIRMPLIPGITDTDKNVAALADITRGSEVELLRYNRLAGAKYPELDMEYTLTGEENTNIDTSLFEKVKIL